MPYPDTAGWRVDTGGFDVTAKAAAACASLGLSPEILLERHASCRWGDIGETDATGNLMALRRGYGSVMSRFPTPLSAYAGPGGWIWIITSLPDGPTRMLRADEY